MRIAQVCAALCLLVVADPVLSEETAEKTPEIPAPTIEPQIFSTAGKQTWHRPPEVKHLLITACGGGGSGAGSERIQSNGNYSPVAGKGGSAAPIETLIINVDADKYEITVGNGGENTVFAWDGGQYAFLPGAAGGRLDGSGGGSVLGSGGGPPPQMYDSATNGTPGQGNCAGGGGSGLYSLGGKGAPGYLAIAPLPDLNRFARTLGIIESLAKTPETPSIGDQTQGSTGEGAKK